MVYGAKDVSGDRHSNPGIPCNEKSSSDRYKNGVDHYEHQFQSAARYMADDGIFRTAPIGIGRIGDVGWMWIYKTVFPDHLPTYETRNHRICNFSVRGRLERIFVCSDLKYQQI